MFLCLIVINDKSVPVRIIRISIIIFTAKRGSHVTAGFFLSVSEIPQKVMNRFYVTVYYYCIYMFYFILFFLNSTKGKSNNM